MRFSDVLAWIGLALVLSPASVQAYVGPGMGAGAVAAVLGVLAGLLVVVVVVVGVVWYPLKKLARRTCW
jgi:hypothetical protein